MPLNKKQEIFCQEYIIDLNGKQAAIRAGYSAGTAKEQAARLLTYANVSDKIAELLAQRAKKSELKAEDVLNEIRNIAFADVKDFLSFSTDKLGRINVTVKNSDEIDTRAISEVHWSPKDGFKFKLYSKDSALVNLAKHLGIFKEKDELPPEVVVTLNIK